MGFALWVNETTVNAPVRQEGGSKNVSWSTISNNVGMGFALWVNETTVNAPVRQETIIQYSNISLNYDIGALVGNFCGPSIVNVSGTNFLYGRYVGLEVLSCWRDSALHGVMEGLMRLEIGHNYFQHNRDGCLYTWNEDDFVLESQSIDLEVGPE